MHKKLKHGIRPYKCDLCDKSFVQKGSLQVHRRQHMGEKQKLYTLLVMLHLIYKKEVNLSCPFGGKSYPNISFVKSHIRTFISLVLGHQEETFSVVTDVT
jgi:hypothetical protein